MNRSGIWPHDLPIRLFIRLQLYRCPPPSPPVSPLFLLLAPTAAWRSQFLSASPPRHLVMKRSTASTAPRYKLPLVLAAPCNSIVYTPKSKGGLSVEPLGASNNLILSARSYLAQFVFVYGLVPGSPHHPSCTNHHAIGQPLMVVRCTAAVYRRRRLRVVVSTLSHRASLRVLAIYELLVLV